MMVALLLLILLYENEFKPVYENKDEIETYFKKIGQIKGQLISKCLFRVFKSPRKQQSFLRISALLSKKRSNKRKGTLYH